MKNERISRTGQAGVGRQTARRVMIRLLSCVTLSMVLGLPGALSTAWAEESLVESNTIAQNQTQTEGDGKAVALPSIVVTGEKIERGLEDTASSASVLSAEDLEDKNGAASVSEAIGDVPNVLFTSTVGAPVIRGQDTQGPNYGSTAFFGGTIPRATINLDGHYLNFYEYAFGSVPIWDLDSIEVFRGPQTTSQGANAIAGAIIANTKDPSFTPEAAYQAEVGNYNRKRASLVFSGPLVKDALAVRLSGDYWSRDTFIDYTNPAFARGETDQDFETYNIRAKLLWEPNGRSGLRSKLTYSHLYNNRPTYETASEPYDNLENATGSMPSWEQETDTGVLDIGYYFDSGLGILNQTQYSDIHTDRVMEPKTSGGAEIDQENLSNDLRLTYGDIDSIFNGVVGLYIARTTSDDILYLRGTSDFDDEKNNIGLYTEMTYRLAERWALTLGLRFQQDRIERSGTSPYASGELDYDESFDAWLPKVSLAYDLTPDVLTVGALVNRGYNPGGVNLLFTNGEYRTFEEETVWNYELFFRARLLAGRLNLNGNLFYSDYKDSQRLLPDYLGALQYGSYVVNADSAQTYGLELALDYLALENLRFRGGLGLLQTEVDQFTAAGGEVYEGNEFSRAPAYMFNIGVDWDVIPKLRVSGDVRYTDGYYSTDENEPDYEVDNFTVANARISYAFREYLQPYVFVNNIFDERAPTYYYDDRSVGGIVANMLEPLSFGVGIKGDF